MIPTGLNSLRRSMKRAAKNWFYLTTVLRNKILQYYCRFYHNIAITISDYNNNFYFAIYILTTYMDVKQYNDDNKCNNRQKNVNKTTSINIRDKNLHPRCCRRPHPLGS